MMHFLQSEIGIMNEEESFFHIIPVPYEESVSYGKGTSFGPQSIIKASQQLELYDGKSYPSSLGIHTKNFINESSPEAIIEAVENSVFRSLSMNKTPIVIGGEHTVTLGAIKGTTAIHDNFGVIQFDAHGDLRNSYENSLYSHACVMRRIHEMNIPIMQVGTRSYCQEEIIYRSEENIPFYDAKENYNDFKLPENFPSKVYITIDIDVFDISLMPATGTPEPGGIFWYPFFSIIDKISKEREIISFDVVEFAPIQHFHAYEYFSARLIYNMMGIIERKK